MCFFIQAFIYFYFESEKLGGLYSFLLMGDLQEKFVIKPILGSRKVNLLIVMTTDVFFKSELSSLLLLAVIFGKKKKKKGKKIDRFYCLRFT